MLLALDRETALQRCRLGQGADCCVWLLTGEEGFECSYYERHPELVRRWVAGLTTAKRNGCREVASMGYSTMSEGEVLHSLGARIEQQDGKVGVRMPTGAFFESSDERPEAIVCAPYSEGGTRFSTRGQCSGCGCAILLAQSSRLLLLKYPGTPTLCIVCALKAMEAEQKLKEPEEG
jgi:hypothetical protein